MCGSREMKDPNRYRHSFFWITPQMSHMADLEKLTMPATLLQPNPLFSLALQAWTLFFVFSLHPQTKFPLKNLKLYRVKADGSCPFCSGGQVWADNCQVCAAETDDYRLYCLSQAQSTLIQQSHLYLIYESLSLSFSLSHTLFLICFSLSLMSPHPECLASSWLWLWQYSSHNLSFLMCHQVVKKRWVVKQTKQVVCAVCRQKQASHFYLSK